MTALAALVRGVRLAVPPFIYADELFYGQEACNLVLRAPATCGIPLDAVSGHPPLGKLLIASGVWALGWHPVGWRVASAVAGTLTVALLYLLARRVVGSTRAAMLASGLLAIDFLHVVQSRIAMLDVFLALFVTASVLCAVLACREGAVGDDAAGGAEARVRRRPWFIAAGAAAGAAMATKLIGVVALGAVAGLVLPTMVSAERGPLASRLAAMLRRQWRVLLGALVVAPALTYALTYVPTLDAPMFTAPWAKGSWVRAFARTQREMLQSHASGEEVKYVGLSNEYVSPAWSWPLLKRPMSYYADSLPDGTRQRVMAVGSPVAWWSAFAALAWLAVLVLQGRRPAGAAVAVTGFLATYLPLVAVSALRGATFFFYMLPCVPFMYVAVAAVAELPGVRRRDALVAAFAAAALGFYAFFHPVLTAVPLTHEGEARRIWFHQCAPAAGRAAPAGWCWE